MRERGPKKETKEGRREEKEKDSPFNKVRSFMVTPFFSKAKWSSSFHPERIRLFSNSSSLSVPPSFLLSGREKVKPSFRQLECDSRREQERENEVVREGE